MAATAPDPREFWEAMDAIDPDEFEAQTRAEGVWPTAGVPTDPAEQEAWKQKFLDDIMAGEQGGVGKTWRDERA